MKFHFEKMKLDLKNPVFWGFSEGCVVEFGEVAREAASRLELRCKSVRLFRSFLAVSKCRGVVWGFRFGADERPPSGIFAFHCAGMIVCSARDAVVCGAGFLLRNEYFAVG